MPDSIWKKAAELESKGQAFCLVMISETSGSVPRRPGAAMLVYGEGSSIGSVGGGTVERMCVDIALETMSTGKTMTRSLSLDDAKNEETGSICGGRMTLVFYPRPADRILHLFGAGHVARPTCHLAAMAGYSVIVYDDNAEYANRDYFPDASSIKVGDNVGLAKEAEINSNDSLVIMSASHETDLEVLKTVKDKLPGYIGVIASKKKALEFRKKLEVDGWSKEAIDLIHMPIGLDIGARIPEEIAISVVSELIQERGPIE